MSVFFFFFNDTATTEIYTLSLHDALPIPDRGRAHQGNPWAEVPLHEVGDRKSTRLNSSHTVISYAVFCLKKKKKPANVDGGRYDAGEPWLRAAFQCPG